MVSSLTAFVVVVGLSCRAVCSTFCASSVVGISNKCGAYCDVYVGGKVRVAKFMMSWNLQLK